MSNLVVPSGPIIIRDCQSGSGMDISQLLLMNMLMKKKKKKNKCDCGLTPPKEIKYEEKCIEKVFKLYLKNEITEQEADLVNRCFQLYGDCYRDIFISIYKKHKKMFANCKEMCVEFDDNVFDVDCIHIMISGTEGCIPCDEFELFCIVKFGKNPDLFENNNKTKFNKTFLEKKSEKLKYLIEHKPQNFKIKINKNLVNNSMEIYNKMLNWNYNNNDIKSVLIKNINEYNINTIEERFPMYWMVITSTQEDFEKKIQSKSRDERKELIKEFEELMKCSCFNLNEEIKNFDKKTLNKVENKVEEKVSSMTKEEDEEEDEEDEEDKKRNIKNNLEEILKNKKNKNEEVILQDCKPIIAEYLLKLLFIIQYDKDNSITNYSTNTKLEDLIKDTPKPTFEPKEYKELYINASLNNKINDMLKKLYTFDLQKNAIYEYRHNLDANCNDILQKGLEILKEEYEKPKSSSFGKQKKPQKKKSKKKKPQKKKSKKLYFGIFG